MPRTQAQIQSKDNTASAGGTVPRSRNGCQVPALPEASTSMRNLFINDMDFNTNCSMSMQCVQYEVPVKTSMLNMIRHPEGDQRAAYQTGNKPLRQI